MKAALSIMWKAARRRSTAPIRCTAPSWKSSCKKTPAAVTRRFRTGHRNIYNLVTKRAVAYEENATMEWIDGNIGSKLTMKYPAVILKGRGAKGDVLSIAVAGKGQHQDAGAKMTAPRSRTTSTIVSKSISKHGGKVTYRGLTVLRTQFPGLQSQRQM